MFRKTFKSLSVIWLIVRGALVCDRPLCAEPGARNKAATSRDQIDREVKPVIDRVDQQCRDRTVYMIGPEKAKRLAELVREKKPRLVVECGTAIGYSGLWIGRELRTLGQGKLITIEIDETRAAEARQNFDEAGLSEWIEVRVGDARELVKSVAGPVDFLFIDCNFENYFPCFTGIETKLAKDAVVAADNVGIGAASMADFLARVRSIYRSQTEWFDLDLPWEKRDAMEITRLGTSKE
jgi:predicted O-methyltransferase YrrM